MRNTLRAIALFVPLAVPFATAQAEQRIPSVSAAVFRDGEVLWRSAMGTADIARNEPNAQLRKKAVFWLGQSNDPRVPDFLGSLLDRRPPQ